MERKHLLGYLTSETKIKAHWKKLPIQTLPDIDAVMCSNCIMGFLKDSTRDFNFCPYCGARIVAPLSDEAKKLIEEERLLDKRDGTIAGKWGE